MKLHVREIVEGLSLFLDPNYSDGDGDTIESVDVMVQQPGGDEFVLLRLELDEDGKLVGTKFGAIDDTFIATDDKGQLTINEEDE